MEQHKLVIAEKPSVAQALAAVLGAKKKKEGYLEGNGWLVSWCVGHLVELAQPEAYDEKYAKWRYEDLPILPADWKYQITSDKRKQFAVLRRLMNDKSVSAIVCATDAGREGELIFRLVYQQAGCQKPILRLWISSMEDAAIRDGFEHLRPGVEYERLYQAALCRAGADWLVGINATRLFSTLYHDTLNIGRVMTPTLALLVQREADIEAFQSAPFYVPEIACGGFVASGEKLEDQAAAETIKQACDGKDAVVLKIEKQKKTVLPPRLYDLTTLQRECNRLFGFTAQQTLDYLQSLYEKKLATYPRTDSQFITADMQATVGSLALWLWQNMPFADHASAAPELERIINDSKVTDHHAILPTVEIAHTDLSALPVGEKDVLMLLAARLLCATGQPHHFETITATLEAATYIFTAKGKNILLEGWKGIERAFRAGVKQKSKQEDENDDTVCLPELQKGQRFTNISASVREGKSTPPKHYTEDSLLAAMETAGAEEMPEDAERKGLGTSATRAATLEKLVSTGFVQRKKKQLLPSEKGIHLITVLPEVIKSPSLTAEWESLLKQVERGEMSAAAFMEGIASLVCDLIKKNSTPNTAYLSLFGKTILGSREPIGICPRCGGSVIEGTKGFFCENKACSFALWKSKRFFSSKKKAITKTIAAALLKEGRVFISGLYSEKTGKTYDAFVVLDDSGDKQVNFKLEFKQKGKK